MLGLGRISNGKTRSLLLRLQELEDCIFLFLEEFEVDYSNNISERSFSFSKVVRQSVSKCFRNFEGFKLFAVISSVLETAAKFGIDKLQMINEIFNGTAAQTLETKFKALSACSATE